jgi:7-keto-8-aminopelargonate synthetase-like enzyme
MTVKIASPALDEYRDQLHDLAGQSRLRTLEARSGLDFTSNDYLGLATSKRLVDVLAAALARGTPIGAGGSRLLRGNAPEHEELEAAAALFFHAERTLFFGSGYVANFAVFSTLPQKGDLVVLDALVHASVREGVRAGRAEYASDQAKRRCGVAVSGSQILPVIIGEDRPTMRIASALRDRGFDVRGVRPPTVPQGTARLRVSLTLNVDEPAIFHLFEARADQLTVIGE